MRYSPRFKAGEWVEVRSKEEILATLDANGRLEHLPFMPQMFQFCGQRFRVFKRAHKTCDTIEKTGARRLHAAVHLENVRCDGVAYGGCEALCLIFWKEAWLKRVGDNERSVAPTTKICAEQQVWDNVKHDNAADSESLTYTCQATELFRATAPLASWDVRQYWEDFSSGNTSLGHLIATLGIALYRRVINLGIGLGKPLRWVYDAVQKARGGTPYPWRRGAIPAGHKTPVADLNLQPGEWVRVKSLPEILATLDQGNKNRGLLFDAEEVAFCGGTYPVLKRVGQLINEKTGKMMQMKTPSVILENVYCPGQYSCKRLLCPRAIYSMWREIWLERVQVPDSKNE